MIVGKEGDRPALVHMVSGHTIIRRVPSGASIEKVYLYRVWSNPGHITCKLNHLHHFPFHSALLIHSHSPDTLFYRHLHYSILLAVFLILPCSSSVEKLKDHVCKGELCQKSYQNYIIMTVSMYQQVRVEEGTGGGVGVSVVLGYSVHTNSGGSSPFTYTSYAGCSHFSTLTQFVTNSLESPPPPTYS
jgi:hypothetical protein